MSVAPLADWLGCRFPAAYRVARPAWRAVMRLTGRPDYWERRRHFRYYDEVVRLAGLHVPGGGRVLDVGANETDVLQRLTWFQHLVALDKHYYPPHRGVESHTMDFLDYRPAVPFDLVLCLQVLEHLQDPASFARKLLATGRTVIVSVPHRWPAGASRRHLHDPVDAATLRRWTQREPLAMSVVTDGRERLIAVYRGDVEPAP